MFKKSEPQSAQPEAAVPAPGRPASVDRPRETATIGPSISIRGDLAGEEDLVIQGRVEGTITLKQNLLTIGKDGNVNATINARILMVDGHVEGDLKGEEQVVLKNSADVRGNISAPRVTLEDGARFKGSIDMEGDSAQRSESGARTNKVTEIKSPSDGGAKPSAGKPGEQQLFKS